MYMVDDRERRKARIICRCLLSRYESVRIAAWSAVSGRSLSHLVLSRLERMPVRELMVWEVLMAIDWMASDLKSKKDRARMVRFVKRMERHGTRSPLLAWKIDDTLYCDLHLNQPREE